MKEVACTPLNNLNENQQPDTKTFIENDETHTQLLTDLHNVTLSQMQDSSKKPLNCNEVLHENLTFDENPLSSASECEQGIPESSLVEIVREKTYPSLALTQTFVPSDLGEYSPSSPSDTDEDDSCSPEVCNNDCNVPFDDVLSLCTSDKDENELDRISLGGDPHTEVEITHSDTHLNNKYIKLKGEAKIIPTPNDLTSVSDENHNINHNTDILTSGTDTKKSFSKLPGTSEEEGQEMEKNVNSDTCGLNIILDRYLDEVAANKNIGMNKNLNVCTDNEDGYVDSSDDTDNINRETGLLSGKNPFILQKDSQNCNSDWVECKPGPSGYIPTIIHGYDSDTDISITDITHVSGNLLNKDSNGTETTTGENKTCDSSSESIKNSLGEENINEEEKREDLKDVTCSICLGPFENRSFLNLCFHIFSILFLNLLIEF